MGEKYLELGFCGRPHGIKGAFSFNLVNAKDSILKKGMEVLLKASNDKSSLPSEGEIYKIKKIQFGNKTIVELIDVNDRNKVEDMIPFTIWTKRSVFPKINDDEIYLSDLVSLKVVDQEMNFIGNIVGIGTNGAQDILSIETSEGEVLEVLFLEQFIQTINIEEGFISIIPPELI
jgi:16S rRNA processing protein RimM